MATTFELDPALRDVLAGLRSFLHTEVHRRHEQHRDLLDNPHLTYGADGRYDDATLDLMREVRMASARAGYYTMLTPRELGGGGLGFEALYRVWETIFYECGGLAWLGSYAVAHWTKGPSPLLIHADPRLRDRYLPGLVSGERTMCFAMSEPDAGSDAWRMRTRAERRDDGWLLNGAKQWISNAAYADLAIVFAVTDSEAAQAKRGGITAFAVPTDTPGFRVTSVIPTFGHAGSNETIIELIDVRLPEHHVVGELGQGFPLAMQGVSLGRLYNSAKGVGLSRWALELSFRYATQRETFGRPLSQYQGLTFPLAESVMELHAAELVALNCARLLDRGQAARSELAMAKAFATEAGLRAIDRSMQAHGAMGFTNEVGLTAAWQQLRQIGVADGSAEILRRQIVQGVLSNEGRLA